MRLIFHVFGILGAVSCFMPLQAATNIFLTEVPDYAWWRGCFGTATGNLMGFWDRHGFPNFYTGPTADGVAPLNSAGGNEGIRSLWATRAGLDGRPPGQYGHEDDYWVEYESTAPDPYLIAGRTEHPPDCVGDFIGLSQNKWPDLDGECAGNIDAFAYVFWDHTGARRYHYQPKSPDGQPIPDLPSGLAAWTAYRGEACEVFSQLADFNPAVSPGNGFSFADLKAEIDAGYPVILFLQRFNQKSRALGVMPNANPNLHAMLAFGYYTTDTGVNYVRFRDSWAGGDYRLSPWSAGNWAIQLPLRGVIGYHPVPRITQVSVHQGQITVSWNGPSAQLYDADRYQTIALHEYVVEKAAELVADHFLPVAPATTEHTLTFEAPTDQSFFLRVQLRRTVGRP